MAMAWLAFAVAALVLASPLKLVWARAALGWTFPFFLWLAVIVVGALVGAAASDRHGDVDGDDER
jgi:hypothetical protein